MFARQADMSSGEKLAMIKLVLDNGPHAAMSVMFIAC